MAHEKAKANGKADTEMCCVFRGTKGVDAAHLFSAGDYEALSDFKSNILKKGTTKDLKSIKTY